MDKELRRRALVDALKSPTPEMRETLRVLKEGGRKELERPDFVWHLLLQSFSTWGGSRGWEGLIGTKENYDRVTFEALSRLAPGDRYGVVLEVLRTAKVNRPKNKAGLLVRNHDLIDKMGGPEEAKRLALAQEGREAKMAFMRRFYGVGDKYARNIWMDAYHPDFHDCIAVDERIQRVTEALGYSFGSYEEHERFYQGVAAEVGLQPWEVDRLLYGFKKEFLAVLKEERWIRESDDPGEGPSGRGERFVWGEGDIRITRRPDEPQE